MLESNSGAESGQNSGSSCKLFEKSDLFKIYSLDPKIVKKMAGDKLFDASL